ncbi:MAG TPA: PD-(D/E)XK nuclease family protein [Methanosarcinales archaeon]|nr:PD-(D/E)XK nuclease family protein [Methanosarcinales archaeon]
MFDKLAIDFGPWSPSKVTEALECPFRFNCSKERKKIIAFANDSAARVGTAIHQYIEALLEDTTRAKDEGLYYALFSDNELTYNEQIAFKTIKKAAEKSVKRILTFKKAHECKNSAFFIEAALSVDKDLKPTEFFSDNVFFRGKIDVAMYLPSNTLVVIDHKSGNIIDIKDNYKFQLLSYLVLFWFGFLGAPGDFPGAMYYLNVLGSEHPDIIKGPEISSDEFNEKVLREVVDTINRAAKSAETNKAIPGSHCKFCNYVNLCPAGVKI